MNCERLQTFRQEAYQLLTKAKDATFELMDAVMTTRHASSLAEFSLNPLFRRQYPSTYEAIEDCRPQRKELMKLYLNQIPPAEYSVFGIDHTAWGRPDAKTLKDRTYQHQKQSQIVAGQGYSTIAWLPETGGSWALPLRHERITSWESPISKAAWQLKQVVKHLQHRAVVLLDREYGNAKWVLATQGLGVECVMRVRSNTCLWGAPPPYSGRGCPRKHGAKFQLKFPETWTPPAQILELDESSCGRVKIQLWTGLHFYPAPTEPVNLILVERLDSAGIARLMPPLWLVWVGEQTLSLEQIWHLYLRRFGLEHWYRFAKQRLHWTMPSFSTPEQSGRWSDLMPLISWQLWLAQDLVKQFRLPWQSATVSLSPGRVAQSILPLLIELGTPASPPKSRGKSSGRSIGFKCTARIRYPIARKTAARPQPQPKTG
ncbi:MAG: transposase [Chamaesiphon sp. CSU_1_12]|nr:transposase [Chamaesiphon sp. CSU_1_12]